MKNVKKGLLVMCSVLLAVSSFAQSNLLNAKTPSQIGLKTAAQLISDNDKPLAYGYVHDRDILMGKTVWEVIDLSERINFPLYFPIDENIGSDRRSLYTVLTTAIKNGKITEVYSDSYFNTKKTYRDIEASLSRIDTTDAGREQINAGMKRVSPEYILRSDLTAQDVTQYKIKGFWYFDKRQSELKYRLLGICPVTPDVYTMNSDEKDYIELFWIFFPSARNVLHEAKAFNDKNSSMPISFDQILNSRRFNSVIYKEENVYGDREIKEYMKDNAQKQLIESDRIKEKIRNFESDMWNY
ncbi:gliding motility protein GldN [Flavobacterium faecale]|uniref:type IX secretion system ring protein PorN/GldN n=1 Tax=Flavobacterium faecale TaxID=1355330 RepID=UPI003AAAC105